MEQDLESTSMATCKGNAVNVCCGTDEAVSVACGTDEAVGGMDQTVCVSVGNRMETDEAVGGTDEAIGVPCGSNEGISVSNVTDEALKFQNAEDIHVMESDDSHVVIALQSSDLTNENTTMPLSKETFVGLGHSEMEAESISQIFIEVCSAESMGLIAAAQAENDPAHFKILKDQSVQANDYDIERSGKLPARRRVIPHKFRDYKNPDSDGDEDGDSDYDPENDFQPVRKIWAGRGRGRGRGADKGSENTTRPGQRGRGRGKRGRGRGVRKGQGFPCTDCEKVFSQKGNLNAHLRIHRDEKPFPCDTESCGRSFRTNESLRRHKLSHLGIKPFECKVCEKKFSCNASLQEHQSIHSDLRPHKCEKCEKTFRHMSTFSRHMVTHTGETPFKCDECGKQFAMKSYLTSHLRVHSGEKPFVCSQCFRPFTHQSDLLRHKVIHTGLKPYTCPICNAKFADPSSRRRHVKEHVSSKPYSCELCGDEFKRAGQLKVHLNKTHNSFNESGKVQMISRANRSQAALSQQEKIIQLISNLKNNPEQMQTISLIGQSVTSAQGEVVMDTPEAECEQILIEAAQAGEVTVQTMGEQFIVTSLPEGSEDSERIETEELQLEPQVVETHTTTEANFVEVNQDGSLAEETVIHVDEAGNSLAVDLQQQHEDVPVEYMYEVIENIDENGTSQEVVVHSASTDIDTVDNNDTQEDTVSDLDMEKISREGEVTTVDNSDPAVDYVRNPDFSSQGYYNWLSNFTELCKLVPMPLDVDLFQKISQVHKTLSDVMATPSGVLLMRENYKILMSISKDLNIIINEHLTFVLDNLDRSKDNESN